MFDPRRVAGSAVIVVAISACGGATSSHDAAARSTVREDAPPGPEAIEAVGLRIYASVVSAEPERLLVDDAGMRRLVDEEAAERYAALRLGVGSRLGHLEPHAFEGTRYAGVCLQGARLEPSAGQLGLREPAWVFERALVAGMMPTGRRVAAWVEGIFVQTDHGFVAVDLYRVEDPRWEHTDLEIAPCDMEAGIRGPQDVGMVTE